MTWDTVWFEAGHDGGGQMNKVYENLEMKFTTPRDGMQGGEHKNLVKCVAQAWNSGETKVTKSLIAALEVDVTTEVYGRNRTNCAHDVVDSNEVDKHSYCMGENLEIRQVV